MILGPVADHDLNTFDAVVRANLRGTFVVNQQAARQLSDGRAIVNFSSAAVGYPTPTYAAYAASKAAVDTITKVLARELREHNITVNAVAPGLERDSTPADIASIVAFLVSEDGHWVNGQVLRGDGEIVSPEPPARVPTRAPDWRDELPEARRASIKPTTEDTMSTIEVSNETSTQAPQTGTIYMKLERFPCGSPTSTGRSGSMRISAGGSTATFSVGEDSRVVQLTPPLLAGLDHLRQGGHDSPGRVHFRT